MLPPAPGVAAALALVASRHEGTHATGPLRELMMPLMPLLVAAAMLLLPAAAVAAVVVTPASRRAATRATAMFAATDDGR